MAFTTADELKEITTRLKHAHQYVAVLELLKRELQKKLERETS